MVAYSQLNPISVDQVICLECLIIKKVNGVMQWMVYTGGLLKQIECFLLKILD